MHFSLTLFSVVSLAGVALAAPNKLPVNQALEVGNVPKITPAVWGSTHVSGKSGKDTPHPAAVIANDGKVAEVVPFTHNPIRGQHAVETGHLAPSFDHTKQGKKSYISLKTHVIALTAWQKPKNGKGQKGKGQKGKTELGMHGTLPPHELSAIQSAVHNAKIRAKVNPQAAAAGTRMAWHRAAKKAAAVGVQKTHLGVVRQKASTKSVAQDAARAARIRNARKGH